MPRVHFGPAAEDLRYLEQTRSLIWDEFWVQGGRLAEERRCEPGVYLVDHIVIGSSARLWIGADGEDTGDNDEVFFMDVSRDENFGLFEFEARFNPRRARMVSFPSDFDLSPFIEPGRNYEVVEIERDATVEGAYETVAVDAGLLVTARSGDKLLFYCDQDMPLNLYGVTQAAHISGYLDEASRIIPLTRRLRA
jgi:hypothetical protein